MSEYEAAIHLGVHVNTYQWYESGNAHLTGFTLLVMERVFGFKFDRSDFEQHLEAAA